MTRVMLWNRRPLDLLDPDPAAITVEVLAHGLARLPRFRGQADGFVSLASHCMMVAALVQADDLRLAALLHDAHAALLGGDLRGPVGMALETLAPGSANALVQRLNRAICQALGVPWVLEELYHPQVLKANERATQIERCLTFTGEDAWWKEAQGLEGEEEWRADWFVLRECFHAFALPEADSPPTIAEKFKVVEEIYKMLVLRERDLLLQRRAAREETEGVSQR